MWEKIFGKKKKKEELEKIVNEKQNGNNKIYPILKSGNWVGLRSGALSQVLIGQKENPEVVIGYGYSTDKEFVFLTVLDLKKRKAEDIIKEAYKNLEDYTTEFEYVKALDNKVLLSSGKDFSSERILSKNHMLKAHKMLDCDELLVSIPRRTTMMVIAKKSEPELLKKFLALHQNAWQDDSFGNAPIANIIYTVKNGDIIRTMSLQKKES